PDSPKRISPSNEQAISVSFGSPDRRARAEPRIGHRFSAQLWRPGGEGPVFSDGREGLVLRLALVPLRRSQGDLVEGEGAGPGRMARLRFRAFDRRYLSIFHGLSAPGADSGNRRPISRDAS